MALVDGVTPLDAANLPHKSGADTVTGKWAFTEPVGTAGGFNWLINPDFEDWPAGQNAAPRPWVLSGAVAAVFADPTTVKKGFRAAQVTSGSAATLLYQLVSALYGPATWWRGKTVTFGAWVWADLATQVRLQLYDGVTMTYSAYHSGAAAWEWLTVTVVVGATASQLRVALSLNPGGYVGYLDGAILVLGSGIQEGIPALALELDTEFRILNARCLNNATTPDSQFDLDADTVILRSYQAPGRSVVLRSPATITCDVLLSGPAANGRDQAGAFTASNWLYFYFIWNGDTLASIVSLTGPATFGATLPAGYTHYALAAIVRFNASSVLERTRIRGGWAYYDVGKIALTAGVAIVETNVSISTWVPLDTVCAAWGAMLKSNNTGAQTLRLRTVAGSDYWSFAGVAGSSISGQITVPNVGQAFKYLWSAAPTDGLTVTILGYEIPNH